MKEEIVNPIFKGFHPDPSVVRVGEDYYVATSTFEWYPGIRIYHSKDLKTWELVSAPLNNLELLDLRGVESSDGIWAPCLSYSAGTFYIIYTVVHSAHRYPFKDTPNYVTTASNIRGPWSAPIYLNSSGFDPSLFHDKDGRKWLVNMQWDYRKRAGGKQFTGILLQEYKDGKLIGKAKNIFVGTKLSFTEGPHLYYRNGFYYLLCAEGGTSYKHAVTLARSKEVTGNYEVCPNNPILTSWEGKEVEEAPYVKESFLSDIGSSNLKKAGHASLVESRDGSWYLFHLCARPIDGTTRCVLGRETAIQEVEWREDGWLYLKNKTNHPSDSFFIENCFSMPLDDSVSVHGHKGIDKKTQASRKKVYEFYDEVFKEDFQTLRIPFDSNYMSLNERLGYLRLIGRESIYSRFYQTLLARRQEDFTFFATTSFEFNPSSFQHMAGLIYRYDENNQFYLFISFDEERDTNTINAAEVCAGDYRLLWQQEIKGVKFELGIYVKETVAQFFYNQDEKWCKFGKEYDITNLSDDFTYGFTGAFVGICVQDLCSQTVYADFKNFCYTPNMEWNKN
jgi:xylan 1,4-beta-xylosidase